MITDKKAHRRKLRYYLLMLLIFIGGAAALTAGAAIVSVNSHNIVSAERISLFEIERKPDETVLRVMGREYYFENGSGDDDDTSQ